MCKKEQCPNFDKCKCGTPKQVVKVVEVLDGVNASVEIDHEIKSGNNDFENRVWDTTTISTYNLSSNDVTDYLERGV